MGLETDLLEESSGILRGSDNGNKISIMNKMITTWDRQGIFALDRGMYISESEISSVYLSAVLQMVFWKREFLTEVSHV